MKHEHVPYKDKRRSDRCSICHIFIKVKYINDRAQNHEPLMVKIKRFLRILKYRIYYKLENIKKDFKKIKIKYECLIRGHDWQYQVPGLFGNRAHSYSYNVCCKCCIISKEPIKQEWEK